jgi:chromosome segregation ATPase
LHGAWQLWVLDWKRTLRQECAKLELQAEEARAGREFIKDELNAMRNECSGDELFRLGIVDELQHSAAEVALLTVDLEEVQSVTRSLEEATAREHEVVEERHAEVSAQNAARESLNVQRAEHRALLEVQLHQALAAPAVLRTELYQCEEQMEVAVAAEAKAKHTAAQLQKELENLHLAAPRRLQERSDEVARLHENVWRSRHMVGSLEAELSRQRLALQARDSVLEAVRITSMDRERMLRTPPPKQRVPEQYDISTATP